MLFHTLYCSYSCHRERHGLIKLYRHGTPKQNVIILFLKNRPVKGLCGTCLSVLRPPLLLWPHTPCSPPPYTPYTCILYTVLITQGRGKGEGGGGRLKPERRLEGKQFTKPGRIYQHDWLYLQSISTCRKVLLQVIILDDGIFLWCLYS